jgi:hypothetical protein
MILRTWGVRTVIMDLGEFFFPILRLLNQTVCSIVRIVHYTQALLVEDVLDPSCLWWSSNDCLKVWLIIYCNLQELRNNFIEAFVEIAAAPVIAFSTAKDFFCLQTMHCCVFPEIVLNWYCAFVCTMQDVHIIPVLTSSGHCWPSKGAKIHCNLLNLLNSAIDLQKSKFTCPDFLAALLYTQYYLLLDCGD